MAEHAVRDDDRGADGTYSFGEPALRQYAVKASASSYVDGFYGGGTTPETAGTDRHSRAAPRYRRASRWCRSRRAEQISGHVSRGVLQTPSRQRACSSSSRGRRNVAHLVRAGQRVRHGVHRLPRQLRQRRSHCRWATTRSGSSRITGYPPSGTTMLRRSARPRR